MDVRNVWLVARNTFRSTITGRWLIVFAAIFFLLILNIPFLYLYVANDAPNDYLQVYAPYLATLTFPFIPLLALPVGAPTIVEERESGVLQFTLSGPISKAEYLSGKQLGLLAATTLAIVIAFGLSSMAAFGLDSSKYIGIVAIMGTGALLNTVMVGLAMVISVFSRRRATALGVGLFFWFLFTSLSDVGVLSSVISLKFSTLSVLPIIIANPVEVCEIIAGEFTGLKLQYLSVPGQIVRYSLGANAGYFMLGAAAVWIIGTTALCYAVFKRQDV